MDDSGPVEAPAPAAAPTGRPLWLKVWQFPLVAMVVAVALVIGAVWLTGQVTENLIQPNVPDPLGLILAVGLLVALLLLVYKLAIRRLGTTRHDDLPLDGRALRDVALGVLGGAALISTCVGLAALAGVYRIESVGGFSDWAQIIFITGVYAGFFEELLMRGILLRWVEEVAGSWIALAISALVFGFLHSTNDNATFFSSLAIAIEAGILLGGAYMFTRSLWLAVGLHAGWNVVQAVWDVPVSGYDLDGAVNATLEGPSLLAGGGFGLEATIFALVVATSAGVWMLWRTVKLGRIVPPMWRRKGAAITAY